METRRLVGARVDPASSFSTEAAAHLIPPHPHLPLGPSSWPPPPFFPRRPAGCPSPTVGERRGQNTSAVLRPHPGGHRGPRSGGLWSRWGPPWAGPEEFQAQVRPLRACDRPSPRRCPPESHWGSAQGSWGGLLGAWETVSPGLRVQPCTRVCVCACVDVINAERGRGRSSLN